MKKEIITNYEEPKKLDSRDSKVGDIFSVIYNGKRINVLNSYANYVSLDNPLNTWVKEAEGTNFNYFDNIIIAKSITINIEY